MFDVPFADPATWVSLATLIALEIVLGIDNLIFIAIVTGRLPPAQALVARRLGLGLAVIMRLALLAGIAWVLSLTQPAFTVLEIELSLSSRPWSVRFSPTARACALSSGETL